MADARHIAFEPVHRLVQRITDGELTPVQIVDAYLDRIARHDEKLHAYIEVYLDDARTAAKAATDAIAAGHRVSPLHGFGALTLEALRDALRRRIVAAVAVLSVLSLMVVDSCSGCSTGTVTIDGQAQELVSIAGYGATVTFVVLGLWIITLAGVLAADHLTQTLEDGTALLSVHRRSILTLGRAGYTEKETRSWAAKLVPEGYGRAMTEGGETFEVALDPQGRVVAFCSRKDDEVMGLYVAPDWARQGVGTALLARAEAAIEAAGHGRVLIGASLTGQAFYEAMGYHVFERRLWKTRGGLEIAVLAMEKVFS